MEKFIEISIAREVYAGEIKVNFPGTAHHGKVVDTFKTVYDHKITINTNQIVSIDDSVIYMSDGSKYRLNLTNDEIKKLINTSEHSNEKYGNKETVIQYKKGYEIKFNEIKNSDNIIIVSTAFTNDGDEAERIMVLNGYKCIHSKMTDAYNDVRTYTI